MKQTYNKSKDRSQKDNPKSFDKPKKHKKMDPYVRSKQK